MSDQKVRLAIAWMRRSHAAYVNQGDRTPDVVRGERAYNRWRKRCQRIGRAA